ncbi:helix-turn-helix transcriptional regulator [Kibdelosporangium lantanae]|uniref:Helix-turn-helix transcriptional regulator n=1 Tax=Kibdelosporangium lantanae TaxID=1497396 RepID=A0ABW3M951_9PSEU
MATSDNRRELARFLRTRRERITPEQVGLPESARRRIRGLRREEVAVLAGLSPTWYTYLEQARDIRPSPEVLDSLAHVLQLTEDERQYLHQLALGHVENTFAVAPAATINSLVADLVQVAGGAPYPLYAIDYSGEVIAWNDVCRDWYTDWSKLAGIERNIVWWMLMNPEARERIVDWSDDAKDIVGRTRALSARFPHDPRVSELLTRLHAECEEFVRWWPDHDVRGQRQRSRRFRVDGQAIRSMRLVVVHPADDQHVTMAFHLPDSDDEEV